MSPKNSLVDLRKFFFRFREGGTEKNPAENDQSTLKMTS